MKTDVRNERVIKDDLIQFSSDEPW